MTAQTTIGGLDVLHGRMHLPLSGVWHAELDIDGDDVSLGPSELQVIGDDVPTVNFVCAIARATPVEGRSRLLVVGGRTGRLSNSPLGVAAPALHYDGSPTPVSAAELLTDICELAGERLAAVSKEELGSATAPSWLRGSGLAHRAMRRVLVHWQISGRLLPNGDLWAGAEAWPMTPHEPELVDPIDDGWSLFAAPRGSTILPGEVVADKQILAVVYCFGDALRAELRYREEA
jgi:hypothetical protein